KEDFADIKVNIRDFQPGSGDQLDLRALVNVSGGNPFGTSGYLHAQQVGTDTVISLDPDGAAGTRYSMQTLLTLQGVTASQLSSADFAGGFGPDGGNQGSKLVGSAGPDVLTGTVLDDTI